MTFQKAMTQVFRFHNPRNAYEFQARGRGLVVMFGDCTDDGCEFWVTTRRAASVLVRGGYELA
jgi:hypothetical protein